MHSLITSKIMVYFAERILFYAVENTCKNTLSVSVKVKKLLNHTNEFLLLKSECINLHFWLFDILLFKVIIKVFIVYKCKPVYSFNIFYINSNQNF